VLDAVKTEQAAPAKPAAGKAAGKEPGKEAAKAPPAEAPKPAQGAKSKEVPQ
jgi:hypothetical protein